MQRIDIGVANDLVNAGLAIKKEYPELNRIVWKYSRKTHFDNLMHTHPYLEWMRGLVTDYRGEVIVQGFKKVWNYLENDCCWDLAKETSVTVVEKVNGFLGLVDVRTLQVSTTGTLDSDMAKLADRVITETTKLADGEIANQLSKDFLIKNLMFEVCDPTNDPHIVEEPYGAKLIGAVDLNGRFLKEEELDVIAKVIVAERPDWLIMTFGGAISVLGKSQNEGLMIRDIDTAEFLCKLKTPHYLAKKGLMRVGKQKADLIFDNTSVFKNRVDEEFHGLVDWIVKCYTKEQWLLLGEQDRRGLIEMYFDLTENLRGDDG